MVTGQTESRTHPEEGTAEPAHVHVALCSDAFLNRFRLQFFQVLEPALLFLYPIFTSLSDWLVFFFSRITLPNGFQLNLVGSSGAPL